MRMSDIANTETMKVSEAAERLTSAKDNASNSEASEPSQSCRDEHDGSSNKQVKEPFSVTKILDLDLDNS